MRQDPPRILQKQIVKIDFHTHILPHADHGSDSVDMSRDQLSLLTEGGTDVVVATPHFYPHHITLPKFLERRDNSAAALAAVLSELPTAPTIYIGAEVALCHGLHRMDGIEKLAIQGTNVILVEMPVHSWDEALLDTLIGLRDECGLHPVLAHPNRYPMGEVKKLIPLGMDVQLNAETFRHWFHPVTSLLLKTCPVVALGSDLHERDENAIRIFQLAQKKLHERMTSIWEASQRLLEGAIPLTGKEHT